MLWSQCFTSLADPSVSLPRFGHSGVCVDARKNWGSDLIVVYGGVGSAAGDSAQTALGDVVVLQVDSGTWSAPDILPGSSAGARAFHSAVALGRRVLVFGGHILTFDSGQNRKRRTFFNDVWQLDTDEWQWSKLAIDAASPSPPGRDMASLLLLDDAWLLLFGGRSETGKSLQDTWLFDVAKCSWQQLKPEGPLPPARKMHSMVKYGSQALLFGGERDNGPLDDLWVLRGWRPGATPRWTQIKTKVSPSPRFGHSLAVVSPPSAAATDDADGGGSSTGGADAAAAAAVDATTPAAVGSADRGASGGGAVPRVSSSSSAGGLSVDMAAAAASEQQRVVLFGGCLDLSSFLSLNRNYVQSKETWLLDLNNLTWVAAASADALGAGPCERMCHSMTGLRDGRLLLLGGRHKEGICRDMWWLDASGDLTVPASPSGAPAAAAAGTPTGASQQQAVPGSATPPRPASQQSLLQSLLGPMRQRDTSQGQLAAAAAAAGVAPSITSSTSETLSLPTTPQKQQQQQDLLVQLDNAPPPPVSAAAGHGSSANQQQQQQQVQREALQPATPALPPVSPAPPQPPPAAAAAAATAPGAAASTPQPEQPPAYAGAAAADPGSSNGTVPQQQQQQGNHYYNNSSSSNQPLAALMDVGLASGELAKLIRNPAAYSADAITKLSSSVSSTVNSLLAGREGQPGSLAGALPAALSRVAPNLLVAPNGGPTLRTNSGGSSSSGLGSQQQNPAMAALRAQMGLPAALQQQQQQAAAGGPCMAPGVVLQELVRLGQKLLGDDSTEAPGSSTEHGTAAATAAAVPGGGSSSNSSSFTTSSSIPPDVLVSAARQHLMSSEVGQLQLPQVALLLADYQHLAAVHYEQQLLQRVSEGFAAAVNHSAACSSAFLQRQPHELLLNQVERLQAEYKQLIMDAPA